ncbi:MAG: hypothetical protein DI551_00080 [Micavibrio aeruginosavorus]|uniref:Uncharacterized protein n=1 Tax=Micavibrio aeruginosavorus TaxID=349221 RepID=A0A2W5NE99_9BACT|nr:MAG: hypothetical protein DI551_00080 [Micavibrio aeruginosavorus]
MSVKICGHLVRWQKPIKIYTLLRAACLVLVMGALASPQSFAAEKIQTITKQSSSGVAAPCQSPRSNEISGASAPATKTAAANRTQRSAGTSSAPALALAMAFGLRSASGPLERKVRSDTCKTTQAKTVDGVQRLAMER